MNTKPCAVLVYLLVLFALPARSAETEPDTNVSDRRALDTAGRHPADQLAVVATLGQVAELVEAEPEVMLGGAVAAGEGRGRQAG